MSSNIDSVSEDTQHSGRTVWKVPIGDTVGNALEVRRELPAGARALHVGVQDISHDASRHPAIMLWLEVDERAPKVERIFYIIGTGRPIPAGVEFIGTAFLHESIVAHVYQVPPSTKTAAQIVDEATRAQAALDELNKADGLKMMQRARIKELEHTINAMIGVFGLGRQEGITHRDDEETIVDVIGARITNLRSHVALVVLGELSDNEMTATVTRARETVKGLRVEAELNRRRVAGAEVALMRPTPMLGLALRCLRVNDHEVLDGIEQVEVDSEAFRKLDRIFVGDVLPDANAEYPIGGPAVHVVVDGAGPIPLVAPPTRQTSRSTPVHTIVHLGLLGQQFLQHRRAYVLSHVVGEIEKGIDYPKERNGMLVCAVDDDGSTGMGETTVLPYAWCWE